MVIVDHNYGGSERMAYQARPGLGIEKATVRAFLKEDWAKGNHSDRFVIGRTITGRQGHWQQPMQLPPGEYVLVFTHANFGPDVCELTVQ